MSKRKDLASRTMSMIEVGREVVCEYKLRRADAAYVCLDDADGHDDERGIGYG